MQKAIQISKVLLPNRYVRIHPKFGTDGIDLRACYLLCLELCDVGFSRITGHQTGNDEIKGHGRPQSNHVKTRSPENIAHSFLLFVGLSIPAPPYYKGDAG